MPATIDAPSGTAFICRAIPEGKDTALRIYAASLATETNTFAPIATKARRPISPLDANPWLHPRNC